MNKETLSKLLQTAELYGAAAAMEVYSQTQAAEERFESPVVVDASPTKQDLKDVATLINQGTKEIIKSN